ncbi:unnamed protein product [Nyctereutes procyonoides]|uniref:(raccoon dog) hypothetical protein n=1 Tax=Nyctereutes procyonoides TaxID=34880 RepID=A0A811YC49_NYCPR|nr:unnamed protein product [Nyctereutes procyonoides]
MILLTKSTNSDTNCFQKQTHEHTQK